jgi:hypothetical protein
MGYVLMKFPPPPDPVRYFLATPFIILTSVLSTLTNLIMGRRNCWWHVTKMLFDSGQFSLVMLKEKKDDEQEYRDGQ